MMDRNQIATALAAKGGRRWTKSETLDRVYFNWEKLLNADVTRYGTGNYRSVVINGESISNSDARRYAQSKVWYDLARGEACARGGLYDDELREALETLVAEVCQ